MDNNKFIENLKKILEEKNISQKELANRIGTTEVSISRYMSGDRQPKVYIVEKIADVLAVSVDYLLGRTDNPTEKKYKHLDNTLIGRVSSKIEKMDEDELDLLDKLVDKIMKENK